MRLSALVTALVCVGRMLHAQQSGLLLGIRLADETGYRSLWIAPERGTLRLVASGPDLIVPTRDGFSRVCTIRQQEITDSELHVWDSLVVQRAQAPRTACTRSSVPSDADRQKARCSNEDESQITFAGPAVLSIESHGAYTCGAHPDGGAEVLLQRLDGEGVPLDTALTPRERARWRRQALMAGKKEFAEIGTFAARTDTDDRVHFSLEDAIGIERGAGQWQAIGTVSCQPYVGCGSETFRLSIPVFVLPRALTGHDVLRPALASIVSRYPHVTDAFSSPSGDILAVRDGDTLRVFAPKGGAMGPPLLTIPFRGYVVMIEWATGRFVAAWTRQLSLVLAPIP